MIDAKLEQFATETQWKYYMAVDKHGSHRKAAKALGVGKYAVTGSIQRLRKAAARQGYSPEHDLINAAPPGFHVKGTSTLYRDGSPALQWVKTNIDQQKQFEAFVEFAESFCDQYKGKAKPRKPRKIDYFKNIMVSYNMGDPHLGMRAWDEETLGGNHDTSIAVNDLKTAVDYLVSVSPDAETGMLVNLGDFFHMDDPTNETSSGNKLDVDGRFGRVIDAASEVMYYLIESLLKKHKKLRIVNVRGNHDATAGLWLNKLLIAVYRNEPRIEIVPNDSKFIYTQFGKVFIGFHHGDRISNQRLYETMTRDKRKEIGESNHVYFWKGHVHHKDQKEIGCCLFETFNTLAARDGWHAGAGYGADRKMESIVLSDKHGIIGRHAAPLNLIRDLQE